MKHFFALLLVLIGLVAGPAVPRAYGLDPITARAVFKLCPEYVRGGVFINIRYRVGDSPTEHVPSVLQTNIDLAQQSASYVLQFPGDNGAAPLHVYATCQNSFGVSVPSAPKDISYCNRLALIDVDGDGLRDNVEDTNCNGVVDPSDWSNPNLVDTDNDGIFDVIEFLSGTEANWPGSSPRLFVLKGSPTDFNGDGNSEDLVWRPSLGMWYLRDYPTPGQFTQVQWGLPGDTPFTYQSPGSQTNVGVVRRDPDLGLTWYFHEPGFRRSDSSRTVTLRFGNVGDTLIPGPWKTPGVTNPAVARFVAGEWRFFIYRDNGVIESHAFGTAGDVLKIADYDGDGLLDVGIFRPSAQKVIYVPSSDISVARTFSYGTPTAHYLIRGDFTGDGRDEITFWEPINGMYRSLNSEGEYTSPFSMQLGLFNVHLPLPLLRHNGKDRYSVVDHEMGLRYWRDNNSPSGTIRVLQWGLPGDAQG